MFKIPETEKKIRNRILSYKSALDKEQKAYGYIEDGKGKRYLLFCLYFISNDLKKSEEYFAWYSAEFSDDVGEPVQKLCWAVSLHRMGKESEAKQKLCDLMLSNLYVIPFLLGGKIEEIDMWHASNDETSDFIKYIPEKVIDNIDKSELDWIKELYNSSEFQRIRKRYVEIYHKLQTTEEVKERTKLLDESDKLQELLS